MNQSGRAVEAVNDIIPYVTLKRRIPYFDDWYEHERALIG